MQVKREVLRKLLTVENVGDQSLVSLRKDDRVVAQLRILLSDARIDQEAAHALLQVSDFPVGPMTARFLLYEVSVRVRHVGVADDEVGLDELAVFNLNAGSAPVIDDDSLQMLAGPQLSALIGEQFREGGDETVHPAQRVPHSLLPLEVRDHHVDRRRPKGIAADKEWMEAEEKPMPESSKYRSTKYLTDSTA